MGSTVEPREPVNPLDERNLLDADASARWRGFPIGYVEAAPELVGHCGTDDEVLLAMLDAGHARAAFRYGRRTHEHLLGAGSIGVFAPGGHADVSHWRCDGVRRIMLRIDPRGLDDGPLAEHLAPGAMRSELEFQDEALASVLRAMVQEVAAGCPSGPLYAESLSLGVAMRLQRRHADGGNARARERGRLTAAQSRRVEARVRGHLSRELSIADLAAAAGFSRSQFVRLFKNTYGCTPYRYVLDARLAQARTLIADGRQPLAEIADGTGFSSQSHMTTAFVRAFGVTPGELRRARGGPV